MIGDRQKATKVKCKLDESIIKQSVKRNLGICARLLRWDLQFIILIREDYKD